MTLEHSLRRVRLGRHDRWLLLNAPDTTGTTGLVLDADDRSLRECHQRAARKLTALELIDPHTGWLPRPALGPLTFEGGRFWREPPPGRLASIKRIVVWRTPFGTEIANAYLPELESGRPIRWDPALVTQARTVHEAIPPQHAFHRRAIDQQIAEQKAALRIAVSEPIEQVPPQVRTSDQIELWHAAIAVASIRPADPESLWATALNVYARTDPESLLAAARSLRPESRR